MHRLAHIVKTVDRAVAVVPKGALLVEASERDPHFKGYAWGLSIGGGRENALAHTHTHQGSSKICTSRESVSPLSRLIRGFRNKYY